MSRPNKIVNLATQILDNPILLRKLSDRVYRLMEEEIRNQRDRVGKWRK
ncbi:MAG: hypothetical protein NW224_12435 [Leptolyngbyaceae cyanobacterium bins.302]|nr:hypothetical protein [Leptolyngbyaceae cyanobacterium bins.302]